MALEEYCCFADPDEGCQFHEIPMHKLVKDGGCTGCPHYEPCFE